MLWHGRNFGNRVVDYQCTNIFKNMAISIVFIFFNIWAGFSGQLCVEDFYYAYYNFCFTAQAMGMVMCCDQDIAFEKSASTLPGEKGDYKKELQEIGFDVAEYYRFCKQFYLKFTLHRIVWWSVYAYWAGAVAYGVPFIAYGTGSVSSDGKSNDFWASGTVSFCILCIAHHFQLFVQVRHWHWYLLVWSIFSFCELPMYMPITEYRWGVNMNLR